MQNITGCILPFAFCIFHFSFSADVACAQSSLQPTPETIKIVLGASNKEHKRVLNEAGQALEAPLVFSMIGRDSVAIEAMLGEQGRFAVDLVSSKAPFEVKNVRVEDGLGRAEIVRTAPLMSPEELRQRCDKQLQDLTGKMSPERKAEVLRAKLHAAAEANPRRFSPQDKKAWEAMKPADLLEYYRKVLQTEIAEEHLSRCGLDYDRSTRNAAEKVVPMFIGLHALMTGQTPQEAEEAKAFRDVMTGGPAILLRQAVTADLRLRIYAEADSADPNAQWFHAQRVASRAVGVSSIRVEGTLDPAKGDSADWWIIERWDPANVTFTTSSGVQFDPPHVAGGVAHLRVSGKQAAKYWFELRVDRGDLKVVVYESHIPVEVKFPY
jgi:hypothetical protein